MVFLAAFPANAKLFELYEFVLPNQMRLIVVPNKKAPIVKQMLWYNVGAVDEEEGKGGSAHLLEHLMFRGTKSVKDSAFNDILQKNGAVSNAFTSQDFTTYHQEADISRLELLMFLEADRMRGLRLEDDDFALERDIVFQERQQVVKNNPLSPFYEALRRSFWLEHPYAKPITGTEKEIASLKQEDVKKLYQQYYAPNNAILVLSGDVEPEEAYALALKYYGDIKPVEKVEKTSFPKLVDGTRTKLTMKLPRVQMTRLIRTYLAPSYATAKEEIFAYMVLSQYLAEGDTSYLYKELVLDQKLAIDVGSSYNYASRSSGTFEVSAVPMQGVDVEELQRALDEVVAEAMAKMTTAELEKTKNKMVAGLIYLKDNPFEAAYIVGLLSSIGMGVQEIENYADGVRDVTLVDVKKVAKQLFDGASMIEGVVEPIKEGKNG